MKRAPSGTDSNLLAPPRKAIQTFELPYSESAVPDLREGLARTRWPDTIPGSGWEFGFDLECLQSICRYWREKFDRKAEVETLGDLHHLQFRTGEQPIHFVHARGKGSAAIPILLLRVLPVVSGGAEHRKPDWPLPSEEVRAIEIAGLRIENGNSCDDNSLETSPRRYRRKTMPVKILQINFKFRASTADYQNLCQSVAEAFAAVPGLRWKSWLLNDHDNEGGRHLSLRERPGCE